MGAKSIQNIYVDFLLAGIEVGLTEVYFNDVSEINKLKPLTNPFGVLEVPNSSVSNVNKAFEEYEMTFFVLSKQSKIASDYEQSALYDDCIQKFSDMITEILGQRNGRYIIDRTSFEVERLNDFSNHLLKGVKVNFTLLAPSRLGYWTPEATETNLNVETNLYGFWRADRKVTVTDDALLWVTEHGEESVGHKYLIHSNSNFIPNWTGTTIDLENTSSSNNVQGLHLSSSLSFPSANFSIYLKLSIPSQLFQDNTHILRMTDLNDGNGFIFGIKQNSNNPDVDGLAFYKIDADNLSAELDTVHGSDFNEFNVDLEPNPVISIGIINNSQTNTVTLMYGENTSIVTGALDVALENVELYIGHGRLEQYNFNLKAFKTSVHAFAIYKTAHPVNVASVVIGDLNSL